MTHAVFGPKHFGPSAPQHSRSKVRFSAVLPDSAAVQFNGNKRRKRLARKNHNVALVSGHRSRNVNIAITVINMTEQVKLHTQSQTLTHSDVTCMFVLLTES